MSWVVNDAKVPPMYIFWLPVYGQFLNKKSKTIL